LKRFYRRKLVQKGMGKAKVAAARKLGIRLWIMMRDQIDYEEFCRRGQLRQKGKAQTGMPDFNMVLRCSDRRLNKLPASPKREGSLNNTRDRR